MQTASIVLFCLLAAGGASTSDRSVGFHHVIMDRNAFGLKPPPPPDPRTLKPPTREVTLVGIVNVLGTNNAVLRITEAKPAAPGQPPVPDNPCMLAEGQCQQGILVLMIDRKAARVKVDNNGQVDTLIIEKNDMQVPTDTIVKPDLPAAVPTAPTRPGIPSMPAATKPPGSGVSTLPRVGGGRVSLRRTADFPATRCASKSG